MNNSESPFSTASTSVSPHASGGTIRVHFIVKVGFAAAFLTMLLMAPSVPGAQPPTLSPSDELTTCAVVFDGKTTLTVNLRPFAPEKFLRKRLPTLPEPNRSVVQTLLSYPRDGSHRYFWPKGSDPVQYDGATTDILLQGVSVMRGEPRARTFCCGLTLEVFCRVLANVDDLSDRITTETAPTLRKLWFCTQVNSPGPEDAMTSFGLGARITSPDRALPGDFVQIWRANRSGHSVIFVDWAVDRSGRRVGIHYWSTQIATDGIGFATELFASGGKGVSEKLTSIARLGSPAEWSAPRVPAAR